MSKVQNYHNRWNLNPGAYQHHSGLIYILMNIVTHEKKPNGDLEELKDPLCIYRDLEWKEHSKDDITQVTYSCPLSYFKGIAEDKDGKQVKRFTQI